MKTKAKSHSRSPDQVRARDLVDEIAASAGERFTDGTPLRVWLDLYTDSHSPSWSESTRRSYDGIFKSIASALGDISLGRLTPADVIGYRDVLMQRGRAARTVRQHIKRLSQVLRAAVEAGRIPVNPADGVKPPTVRPSIKRPFSLAQFKALLNATDGEWHLLILIGGLTGQRLQDVLGLQHDDVTDSEIRFRRRKNKDWHVVPRHPGIAIPAGFGPLFPSLSQLPLTGSRSVSAQFRDDILPHIGIRQEYGAGLDGGRKVTEYSFHSLRHMLSTELNRTGASAETRMLIVGHESAQVSRGYTHADMETAARAIAAVAL